MRPEVESAVSAMHQPMWWYEDEGEWEEFPRLYEPVAKRPPRPRATREVMRERAEWAADLLGRRLTPRGITRAIRARFGVSRATSKRILNRARLLILARMGTDREREVHDSAGFFLAIVGDVANLNRHRTCLRAMDAFCKLMGLYQHGPRFRRLPPTPKAPPG